MHKSAEILNATELVSKTTKLLKQPIRQFCSKTPSVSYTISSNLLVSKSPLGRVSDAVLTGSSIETINAINIVCIKHAEKIRQVTTALSTSGVRKDVVKTIMDKKVAEYIRERSRGIVRPEPIKMESIEDFYGSFLHLQEFYSNDLTHLKKK